jgi:hypothetical protein
MATGAVTSLPDLIEALDLSDPFLRDHRRGYPPELRQHPEMALVATLTGAARHQVEGSPAPSVWRTRALLALVRRGDPAGGEPLGEGGMR